MTMYTAFGRFSGGDLQFVEYDYPNEAAFRQDLGGNGFAAKYILPTDWIKKYNWDWWVDRNGQKYRYGPNYTKLASKFKKCVKWYEENKDNLPDQITSFYDAAKLWDDYDIYWANAISKPYQSLEDYINQMTQPKGESMIGEYIDKVLKEKGLGRALGKMGFEPTRADKQYNVCLISANRGERTTQENTQARLQMQKMLRDMGYGYDQVKGGWTEDGVSDSEPSFLVTDIYDNPEKFIQRMIALGAKFDQQSILIKPKGATEPARYLTTTHHVDKDDETGEEATYNIGDEEMSFSKVSTADTTKDPYWTQIGNKAFKLEGKNMELASQLMTLTEDQVDALYNVPYSKYGRNFPALSRAHIAYEVMKRDLGLTDCTHSHHPYGQDWGKRS